ncbi:hypothetical protein FO519_006891 [Halicephalobus sp. NKZ332]|nr:hypothetical protein FO519_006891 [Halicephalobus sp. NKZ332]
MRTLHQNVVVIDKGVIEGKGLVAIKLIKKGEVVSPYVPGQPTYSINDVLSMAPEEYKVLRHYGYQCRENIIIHEQNDDTVIANRDIQPGEEVTYDYATTEVTLPLTMECHCGTSSCRKVVTNLDHRDPAWQAKYGNMLPQHTLKAIAEWNASVVMKDRSQPVRPTCAA